MSKRISADKGTFNPESAARHIRLYLSENKLTYWQMGFLCGRLNYRTISKIASGKDITYAMSTFEAIAEYTKVDASYWTGLSENKTSLEDARIANDFFEAEDRYYKKIRKENLKRYKPLFNVLGYEYNIDENDTYSETAIHTLTKNGNCYFFDSVEFEKLVSHLEKFIDFTCYEKENI